MIDTGIKMGNINVHENLRKKSQANTLREVATVREKPKRYYIPPQ
jgi:hypothetical protein